MNKKIPSDRTRFNRLAVLCLITASLSGCAKGVTSESDTPEEAAIGEQAEAQTDAFPTDPAGLDTPVAEAAPAEAAPAEAVALDTEMPPQTTNVEQAPIAEKSAEPTLATEEGLTPAPITENDTLLDHQEPTAETVAAVSASTEITTPSALPSASDSPAPKRKHRAKHAAVAKNDLFDTNAERSAKKNRKKSVSQPQSAAFAEAEPMQQAPTLAQAEALPEQAAPTSTQQTAYSNNAAPAEAAPVQAVPAQATVQAVAQPVQPAVDPSMRAAASVPPVEESNPLRTAAICGIGVLAVGGLVAFIRRRRAAI